MTTLTGSPTMGDLSELGLKDAVMIFENYKRARDENQALKEESKEWVHFRQDKFDGTWEKFGAARAAMESVREFEKAFPDRSGSLGEDEGQKIIKWHTEQVAFIFLAMLEYGHTFNNLPVQLARQDKSAIITYKYFNEDAKAHEIMTIVQEGGHFNPKTMPGYEEYKEKYNRPENKHTDKVEFVNKAKRAWQAYSQSAGIAELPNASTTKDSE